MLHYHKRISIKHLCWNGPLNLVIILTVINDLSEKLQLDWEEIIGNIIHSRLQG